MAALAAVVVGLIAVAYVLLAAAATTAPTRRGSSTRRSWVKGDQIEIGGTAVGSIDDIALTDNGQAEVSFTLQHDYGPLPEGTKAIVRQATLSGIANRYIDIQPGYSKP